ncbi:hypothetical protein [Deinococcus humi]|uniref:Uncharacterized protein n=1 Tax=Deinococcus humi TaxID=662880 RepID=A0A7W8JZU0_9DEIO|nr:hypothetical protein [Deinococcus humi]MBB5366237.1 hypothetical protein [Deinococcus humi]
MDDAVWAREARRAAWFQRGPRVMLVLGAALLLYILISSLLVIALNALSIGYGPQGLRPLLLGSPLPVGLLVLLIPCLAAVSLVRLGIRPALIWVVPVAAMVLETPVARLVTTTLPMNLPDAITDQPIDLMPSGSPDLAQILSILLLKALAVGLGVWLGQHSLRNTKMGQAGLQR